MSHRKPLVALVVASVAFSSLAFVRRVLADVPTTCTSDAECSKGFTCQPWAVSGGTAPACPPDAPDCAVSNTPKTDSGGGGGVNGATGSSGAGAVTGTDVGSGNVSGTTPTTTVISRCEPGPCQADSDCGPNMVCHTESYGECSTTGSAPPPCEPGQKCESAVDPTQTTCTTRTRSFCAFHWQLPCNADADCGTGFTCRPQISGACSGGTPVSAGSDAGGSTGSAADPGRSATPHDNCVTTMTFPGSCQPVATTCTVDADCPGDWVCQEIATPPSRGDASGAGGDSGQGTSGTATGAGAASGSAVTAAGAATGSRMCNSPFLPPLRGSDATEGAGTPTSGSTPPGGTGGTTAGSDKDAAGSGGANGAAHVAGEAGASNGAGGCSVSGRGGAGSRVAGALSVLTLLGLGAVVRRRRR